jgi:predicted small lipoprotein YifL
MQHGWAATTAFALFPLTLLGFKRRRKLSSLLSLLLLATLATGLTACGADKYPASTPPGTYIIPVTASAHVGTATYAQTVNLTLIVAK